MLLPGCLQNWNPENDPAHFVIDAVAALKLDQCSINHRGTGDAQYPPEMMLTRLVYCYATRIFSSRCIEHAAWQNVAVRYIYANTHPDHDTLCTFRRKNGPLIQETFVKILLLACEMKLVKWAPHPSMEPRSPPTPASTPPTVMAKPANSSPPWKTK